MEDSGAYYSWAEEAFAVNILLDGDMDPEGMEVGDAIVTLPGGERYSALMMTREAIHRLMDRHAESGESLHGAYWVTPDLIIIRAKGVGAMVEVIRDIVVSGPIASLLPRIDGDGTLSLPSM
ncbi:hypothetical protein [Spongiactinospora rosea]|uniref:hypothetical protein n=1 Tax=Spongiactinospora rosea TaxID=2248750 RepID=UPI0011C0716D|nr:hypothetical protein [Spongiactinospora rosea]